MEAEKIQDLQANKHMRVYVFDETMSPSDVRSNLVDDVPHMGPYDAWVKFTKETEPVDPSAGSAKPVAAGPKHHIVEPNKTKASNLHDEIKLRVTSNDDEAPLPKVLDVCKVGKLSDALEELLGRAVVALIPNDDDGSMMVRLHLKDVAMLQSLNEQFLR